MSLDRRDLDDVIVALSRFDINDNMPRHENGSARGFLICWFCASVGDQLFRNLGCGPGRWTTRTIQEQRFLIVTGTEHSLSAGEGRVVRGIGARPQHNTQ